MATPKHTPKGRGYESSLNYYSHGNWAWTEAEWQVWQDVRHQRLLNLVRDRTTTLFLFPTARSLAA